MELTTNQQNQAELQNLLHKIPIQELKESVIIPFYFSHGRYENNAKWTSQSFKQTFGARLTKLVATCNYYLQREALILQEDEYTETYKHLDFKKTNHPISWNILLNPLQPENLLFNRIRIVTYYDERFDVLSGSLVLHCDHTMQDQKLISVLKHSYILKFFNYFIEDVFSKKIVSQYPHLFSVITENNKNVPQDDMIQEITDLWVEKVNKNFFDNLDYLLADKFVSNHITLFFILLNVLNLLKPFNEISNLEDQNATSFLTYLENILKESEKKAKQRKDAFENKQRSNKIFLSKRYDFKTQPLNFSNPMYLYSLVMNDLEDLNTDEEKKKIYMLINMFNNPDSYLVGPKSKVHLNEFEFLQLIDGLLNNNRFVTELENHALTNRFYNNYHFQAFNFQNSTMLLYSHDSLNQDAEKSLVNFYTIASSYFASYRVSYLTLNNYTSYVINSEYNKKSFTYRRIRYDLQILNLNLFYNFYGVDSIKYIIQQFDSQLQLQAKIQDLMAVVRKIDEAEKLIVERNSIATAFISALFIGIIWFCDQCYASLQSTGSGNDAPSWNNLTHSWTVGGSMQESNGTYFPPWTIDMSIIYGFIGIAAFVCFVVTILLIYQSIKLYFTYHNTKKEGIENVY